MHNMFTEIIYIKITDFNVFRPIRGHVQAANTRNTYV